MGKTRRSQRRRQTSSHSAADVIPSSAKEVSSDHEEIPANEQPSPSTMNTTTVRTTTEPKVDAPTFTIDSVKSAPHSQTGSWHLVRAPPVANPTPLLSELASSISTTLNPHMLSALSTHEFNKLTPIQASVLPYALSGHDLLAQAKTGSGKTLAFLVPIIELLRRAHFRSESGTGALIMAPTRELCQQIEGVALRVLLKPFHGAVTIQCCIGGRNRRAELAALSSGRSIVVGCPGRILDHLTSPSGVRHWNIRNLAVLCIDEADRVLDHGFEPTLREIVPRLPPKRQTWLLSATLKLRMEQFARVALRPGAVLIDCRRMSLNTVTATNEESAATVETLEQNFVRASGSDRFLLLHRFLQSQSRHDRKILVFFASRASVIFHQKLLDYLGNVPCAALHGQQVQAERSKTYMHFCNAKKGILLTTDVAARGLDIPSVEWIVQFDPPDDVDKYIHRVGRTARAGSAGKALMFLRPSEHMLLSYLYSNAHITLNEFVLKRQLSDTRRRAFSELVENNGGIRRLACDAYEGLVRSYATAKLKKVFEVHSLDLRQIAAEFGLTEPPPLSLETASTGWKTHRKRKRPRT